MIILRDKTFGRENHKKLSKDQQFLPDPRLVQFIGECQIEISATNKFGNDKRKLGPIDQHKVDLLKKDIKNGYIYEDGPNEGNTEFLDFPGKESHLMSKTINGSDRFNYRVYEPVVEEDENGLPRYKQKVVLESCWGHETNGGRTYSEQNS